MSQPPARPAALPEPSLQSVRLRAFLRALLVVALVFGLVEVLAFIVFGDPPTGLTGVVIFLYSILLAAALRNVERGRFDPAVTTIWLGFMGSAVVVVFIQPVIYPALVLVPLLAVAVSLPFTGGRERVRMMLTGWLAIAIIALVGILLPRTTALPDWFVDAFRLGAVVAASGLVLLLFGQFSERLTGALTQSESANLALTEARAQLEEERQQLEIILRGIAEAVVATDHEARIVFMNGIAETLTGWAARDAVGRRFGEVFDLRATGDRAPLDDFAAAISAGEAPRDIARGTVLVPRVGSERSVAGSAAPLRDAAGRTVGAVVICHDITADLAAEEERLRMDRRIRETQKLESLGLLAGGIAHDFNNLLVAILGNASLALSDLPSDSPARESVEQIELASRRAADLARQLLAYSGRGRFDVHVLDLNMLIGEVAQLLRASIPKGVQLRLDLAPELPAIEADGTQLRQVVMNLVVNAGEAIGGGDGRVVVRTFALELDRDYLSRTVLDDELPPGTYIALEVDDSGAGMDEATRARIFDPFFSTKFTGRGLGLAAVLGIVRGHRGAIQVYSEPGGGTSFRILIPATERPAPSGPPRERPPWTALGTVLVVDDEPGVREVAGAMLRRAGLFVLLAADGAEAVEQYRSHAASIDAVLLDLTMPRMGGAEAFEAIRAIRPDARVILTSGYSEEEAGSRFVGRGLAGFLQKPFTGDELAAAVSAALDGAKRGDQDPSGPGRPG